MEPNIQSDQQIDPAGRIPPYTILAFYGKNYRVITRQYQGFIQMTKVWSVFWFLFGLFLLGSGFILLFEQKIQFILILALGSLCLFTLNVYLKRNQLTMSILYSSINIIVWIIPVIILAFLQIKQIIIPLCFYSKSMIIIVTIEAFLSFKYMENKSQIVGKFLIMMEIMIIGLKVDQKIHNPWKDVLFSHVVFFFFLALCVVFMTAYLIYMKFKQNEENLLKQKIPGALFIYFNTIAFCLISAIPLFEIFLEVSIWIVCFSLSSLLVFLGIYIHSYRKEIVIFFCTLNQIKAFDQVISFEPIQGIKNCNSQGKQKDKKLEPIYLYRISQNWLSTNPIKQSQSSCQQENPEQTNQVQDKKDLKMTDCTICLDSPAEVVWMPCGHLTVCMECCSSMFEKKNFNCVLCKKIPQQIFMIDTKNKQKTENVMINENNLSISIQKDDASIISGSVILESQKKNSTHSELFLKGKKLKQQKIVPNNKTVFLVCQAYNVKII